MVRISVLAIGLGLIITALLITLTDSQSQQTQEIELDDASNIFNNQTTIQGGYLKNVVISSSNEAQDGSPKLPYS